MGWVFTFFLSGLCKWSFITILNPPQWLLLGLRLLAIKLLKEEWVLSFPPPLISTSSSGCGAGLLLVLLIIPCFLNSNGAFAVKEAAERRRRLHLKFSICVLLFMSVKKSVVIKKNKEGWGSSSEMLFLSELHHLAATERQNRTKTDPSTSILDQSRSTNLCSEGPSPPHGYGHQV